MSFFALEAVCCWRVDLKSGSKSLRKMKSHVIASFVFAAFVRRRGNSLSMNILSPPNFARHVTIIDLLGVRTAPSVTTASINSIIIVPGLGRV